MKKTILFRSKLVILLAILVCTFAAVPVWAAGGGGSNDPLQLESSTIPDGTQGVDITTAQVTLTFSKNVVNSTVKDNNAGCFSIASDDSAVPFTVEMADDVLYPDSKNDIVLVFAEQLQPSATYVITVAPELQSKSGVSLAQEVTISFTTAEGTAAVPATDTPEEGTTVDVTNTVPAEIPAAVSPEAAAAVDTSAELPATGADAGSNALLGIVFLAAGTVLLVYRHSSRNA